MDVTIVPGAQRVPVVDPAGPYARVAGGFAFTRPGLARYVVVGDVVTVEAAPDAAVADLSAMLVATVLPALLWMRGDIMLHAAAVVLPGATCALAVAGGSGVGKSTWLARVVAAGGRALADDSIRVAAGVAHGLPGGRFIARSDGTRAFVAFPRDWQCLQAPLGAIVILAPGGAPRRLTGVAAVEALLAQRHRPAILRVLGREAAMLGAIADIARAIPVVRWPVCDRAGGS